jgi:LCP family protein required for cell wall assembly
MEANYSNNPNNDRIGVFSPPPRRRKRKFFAFLIVLLLVVGGFIYGSGNILSRFNGIFTNKKSIFTRVSSLFISNNIQLQGEDTGTVNLLLLGVGGEGHDGAYLTDTMIVASINVRTNEVVLTSIPRDWVTTIPGHGINKINAVYAYGLQDHNNDQAKAGAAAAAAVEQLTGFRIPYYSLVDFKGFVNAVNHVGGLDVTVDRTFSDSTFPNDFPFDTKGFLGTVTFYKGAQHMDGRTALIFARSRHGTNDEGSDFARSERQKKIIIALKDKAKTLNVTNLVTLNKLLSDFTSNFHTNLEPNELLRLASISKNIPSDNIYSLSLAPQGDLICDTTIDQLTGKQYIHPVEETTPETTTTPTTSTTKNTSTTTSSSTSTGTTSKTQTTSQSTSKTATTTTSKSTSSTSSTSKTPTGSTTTPPATGTTTPTTPTIPTQIPMYIVEPCYGKTTADVHQFLANYLDAARLTKENATIEIQNSTGKALATTSWRKLADHGFNISFVAYPGKTAFDRTIIYDNTKGAKVNTLKYLENNFALTPADVQFTNSKADFVIVLGNDSL